MVVLPFKYIRMKAVRLVWQTTPRLLYSVIKLIIFVILDQPHTSLYTKYDPS